MMKHIRSTTNPKQFKIGVSLQVWNEIRDWLDENKIQWRAAGEHRIEFDSEENATLFALRWL